MDRVILAVALALAAAPAARAQDAAGGDTGDTAQQTVSVTMPEHCAVLDSSRIISVVVCDGPRDEATFAEAGRAACGARRPCGAWIWPSRDVAPATAPANHDGLTQAEVVSSQGVWVAERELFVRIERAE
ncbi:hypothetical protein [Rhodovulum visakhapatnamense]|uniref:Secreted protein n=1 Tax=Rhodovulum visakhapatnamense TaxID=364297 RepID=A0A4R8FC75_9RHOB|nr:hypothetical protein [Rhodovulum visakhapatnamense]TDX23374.1 hypothetical protein EV657_12624 [Rhodovulum visakhapatnamense]